MQIPREFEGINPDFTTASITDLWVALVTTILEFSQTENDAALNSLMDESGTEFSEGKYSYALRQYSLVCMYMYSTAHKQLDARSLETCERWSSPRYLRGLCMRRWCQHSRVCMRANSN